MPMFTYKYWLHFMLWLWTASRLGNCLSLHNEVSIHLQIHEWSSGMVRQCLLCLLNVMYSGPYSSEHHPILKNAHHSRSLERRWGNESDHDHKQQRRTKTKFYQLEICVRPSMSCSLETDSIYLTLILFLDKYFYCVTNLLSTLYICQTKPHFKSLRTYWKFQGSLRLAEGIRKKRVRKSIIFPREHWRAFFRTKGNVRLPMKVETKSM